MQHLASLACPKQPLQVRIVDHFWDTISWNIIMGLFERFERFEPSLPLPIVYCEWVVIPSVLVAVQTAGLSTAVLGGLLLGKCIQSHICLSVYN